MAELNVQVYVVETPQEEDGGTSWWSVHTTEDHTDAVKVAKEYPRARVRRFWVSRTIEQRDTLKPGVIVPEVPLVDMVCMDHPDVKMRWMPDGRVSCPIVCNICHKPLVTQETVSAMNNPIDLSET